MISLNSDFSHHSSKFTHASGCCNSLSIIHFFFFHLPVQLIYFSCFQWPHCLQDSFIFFLFLPASATCAVNNRQTTILVNLSSKSNSVHLDCTLLPGPQSIRSRQLLHSFRHLFLFHCASCAFGEVESLFALFSLTRLMYAHKIKSHPQSILLLWELLLSLSLYSSSYCSLFPAAHMPQERQLARLLHLTCDVCCEKEGKTFKKIGAGWEWKRCTSTRRPHFPSN